MDFNFYQYKLSLLIPFKKIKTETQTGRQFTQWEGCGQNTGQEIGLWAELCHSAGLQPGKLLTSLIGKMLNVKGSLQTSQLQDQRTLRGFYLG